MSELAPAVPGRTLGANVPRTEEISATRTHVRRVAVPYTSPYLAGVGIGVVLLLSFVLMGRGLGASGAFSSVVSATVATAAPSHATRNAFYARYLGDGATSPLADWLVFESVYDDTNHLLPDARLREMFAQAGIKPNDTIVAYCHVGQQATALLLAAEALGYNVKLYDGSFQDWQMRKLPVESSRKDGQ